MEKKRKKIIIDFTRLNSEKVLLSVMEIYYESRVSERIATDGGKSDGACLNVECVELSACITGFYNRKIDLLYEFIHLSTVYDRRTILGLKV